MRIVIAGGTGFLGRPLASALGADGAGGTGGNDVIALSRSGSPSQDGPQRVAWTPDGTTGPWASTIDGAGAVVNLAGESIAARRWTAAQKQRILDSRVQATRSLVEAIKTAAAPPPVFVSG
jgi:NAD dependent epimerase/dehydratase family enzyme